MSKRKGPEGGRTSPPLAPAPKEATSAVEEKAAPNPFVLQSAVPLGEGRFAVRYTWHGREFALNVRRGSLRRKVAQLQAALAQPTNPTEETRVGDLLARTQALLDGLTQPKKEE